MAILAMGKFNVLTVIGSGVHVLKPRWILGQSAKYIESEICCTLFFTIYTNNHTIYTIGS